METRTAVAILVLVLSALSPIGSDAREPAAAADAKSSGHRMVDPARGELLYRTTCAACHDEQAHWRQQRLVSDWPQLIYQVTRWQGNAGQNWRAQEIEDVAVYLNRRYYQVECPLPGCTAEAERAAFDGADAMR